MLIFILYGNHKHPYHILEEYSLLICTHQNAFVFLSPKNNSTESIYLEWNKCFQKASTHCVDHRSLCLLK